MNISTWPLNKIMQLPDWCFGPRWTVGLQATIPGAASVFDISEITLPERFVIWELQAQIRYVAGAAIEISISLGEHLPVNDAAFDRMIQLLPGLTVPSGRRGTIEVSYIIGNQIVRLRKPVQATSRHLVGRFNRVAAEAPTAWCFIVISSIPREVPDWLILAQGKNL